MSAAQISGLPGLSTASASGSNHKRSEFTGSRTSRTGFLLGAFSAESTQAGSQTDGSEATSSTSTDTLPDCARPMIFAVEALARETPKRASSATGVRRTGLDLFKLNGVSLWSDLTTLPDSVACKARNGSGVTGGSSRTGCLSSLSQRVNQL